MHMEYYFYSFLIAAALLSNDAMGTDAAVDRELTSSNTVRDVVIPNGKSRQSNATPLKHRLGDETDDTVLFPVVFSLLGTRLNENKLRGTSNKDTFTHRRSQSGYNPVRNLRTSSDQVAQLAVNWDPPALDTTLYVNVGYVVKYNLIRHVACGKDVENSVQLSLDVNTTLVILNDLEDYATYNISVTPKTRNLFHKIERFGNSVSTVGRTLSNAPVTNLQPVTLSHPTSKTNVMFSWNRVTCENQNGPDFTYSCALYEIVEGNHLKLFREATVTRASYVFTDLVPCIRYRFGVTPRNAMDTAYTEHEDVQTPPAPFNVVRDLSVRPDDETGNMVVTWKPPLPASCPVVAYSLTVTLQKQQACPQKVLSLVTETKRVNGTSFVLSNTLPYATYVVSVSTHGEEEKLEGPPFEEVTTTPKRAPGSSPSASFNGLSSHATSLVFSWDPVPCEDLNGAFMQYTYTLNETGSEALIDKGHFRRESKKQKRFEGLNPCTNYTFSIRVENDFFQSNFSTVQGETKTAIPGHDLDFSLRPGTYPICSPLTACLVATWQTPQANSCPITTQAISLYQLDDDNCTESSNLIASFTLRESDRQWVFRDLKHNSLYRATLVVSNSAGHVTKNDEERTIEAAPTGSPQHVALRRPIRRTTVNISWEEPECGFRNGQIIKYSYVLRQGEVLVQTGVTQSKWHQFGNLRGATMYSFTVNASTALGTGPDWLSVNNEPLFFRTRR